MKNPAQEVIKNLVRPNCKSGFTLGEQEAIEEAVLKHDFLNPLSKTVLSFNNVRVFISGNSFHLAIAGAIKQSAKTIIDVRQYIMSDGTLLPESSDINNEAREEWANAFIALGWKVTTFDTDPIYWDPEKDGYADYFTHSNNIKTINIAGGKIREIKITLPLHQLDGRVEPKSIIIHSKKMGQAGAKIIEDAYKEHCAALPIGPEKAQENLEAHIRRILEKEDGYQAEDVGIRFQGSNALITQTMLDGLLTTTTKQQSVRFQVELADKGKITEFFENELKSVKNSIKLNNKRTEALKTGLKISTIAQNSLEGAPISTRRRRFIKALDSGKTLVTKYNPRDGFIGVTLSIIKNSQPIVTISNNQFTIKEKQLPETVLMELIGKKLSDVIDSPYVAGDLAITSIKNGYRCIIGRFQDNGDTSYENYRIRHKL